MRCRVCDAKEFEVAVDLKKQPWGNHFLTVDEVGKEPLYPLRVIYCTCCQTAQLDYTVPKEVMFSNHTYLSGITQSLRMHFQEIANQVDQTFFWGKPMKRVLDIGSNDGSQLFYYQQLGYEVLGIESSVRTAQIANEKGIPTLNAFFNLSTAETIQEPFDVINASGVFFHLEELHSVTAAIKKLLKTNGVFVVQFIYMKKIMENVAFDQIYHEHLLYYTLRTIETLLQRHGLSLFDACLSPIHGGSIIGYVGHIGTRASSDRLRRLQKEEEESKCNELGAYHELAIKMEQLKAQNLEYLQKARQQGKKIFGMGAPVKGNTLLNYFGIDKSLLDCLVEKNPLRKGLFSPGSHLEIKLEDELASPPDIYYVLAWNFRKEILKNNQHLLEKGVEFHFPVYA
ncbi:MAG: class I SAM-dependent methyltransferase [Simkania sp.]|nr:class I SAM-dependent methyltransferase [Simkania sp.]